MLTLKTLVTRLIAISALGVAMTAPVIAATKSTDTTPATQAAITAPATTNIDGVDVPTTRVMAATDAEDVSHNGAHQEAADDAVAEAAADAKAAVESEQTEATDSVK